MTIEELKELLKGRIELEETNSCNEALTKKCREWHKGKADAYVDALWLVEMVEKTNKISPKFKR